jgi:hypothetical protein
MVFEESTRCEGHDEFVGKSIQAKRSIEQYMEQLRIKEIDYGVRD